LATGLFAVEKAFFHAAYDLVVLTGVVRQAPVRVGMYVDLPPSIGGPGWVPIASLEYVQFPQGRKLAVTLPYAAIQRTRLEPVVLEGKELEVRFR
jgi:hypothetical protein